jgi:hypothetical protein
MSGCRRSLLLSGHDAECEFGRTRSALVRKLELSIAPRVSDQCSEDLQCSQRSRRSWRPFAEKQWLGVWRADESALMCNGWMVRYEGCGVVLYVLHNYSAMHDRKNGGAAVIHLELFTLVWCRPPLLQDKHGLSYFALSSSVSTFRLARTKPFQISAQLLSYVRRPVYYILALRTSQVYLSTTLHYY